MQQHYTSEQGWLGIANNKYDGALCSRPWKRWHEGIQDHDGMWLVQIMG
jgi:hypothetical protein